MDGIFKKLEDLRAEWLLHDLTEAQCDKLKGECKPGCKVEIHWNKEYQGMVDEGYVFIVDGMDADIGDCFVHCPNPDNSGGKDRAWPEWNYMTQLMANPFCEKIVCK